MIVHKESLYMKIVCAVIGGCVLSFVSCIDKKCDVKEIEALFLEHPDERIKSAFNGSRYIIEATTINVQCRSTGVLSWVYCKDGKWIYQDVTCPLNQTNTIHNGLERNVKKKRKRFFGLLLYGLICLFSRCSRPAPRDNVKPHIRNCPPDFYEEAIPFQYYTFVNWTEPTAWDNKDGTITATLNGKRSGAPFFEGQTNVGYFAKDSSGNMGTCNFVVHVKVIRCQRLSGMIENGYRVCHLGSDMVKGTVCRYGCYQGHSLKGQSKLECLANGQWSFKKEPYCEKKKCKAIRAKKQLSFSCTEEYYFRSICTYKCSQGYEIPDTVRRTKVCLATGIWNGKDPYCEDTQPPTIDHCPTTLIFYLKENESSTYINWNIPTVSDNSDNHLKAKQVSGPARSTKQDVNTYTISYEANDHAGNNAKICSFVVVVKQLRCRRMYALPYMDLNCTGTKLGSSCSFSCEDNSVLNGTHTTFCRKVDRLPMSKWDMNKQPFCQVLETCPDPDAPFNGALACDVWLGGRLCHPSCAKGYSVLVTKRLPSLIVCLVDGRWLHRDKITSCLARENSVRQLAEMSAEYYFNGNCNDITVQNQIKQKFIQIIQRSPSWKSKCNDKCDIQNVKVICGATERKRSTGNLFIKMDLNFESGSNKNLTSEEYESEVVIVTDVLHILKEEFASNTTTALNRNSELIYLSMTSRSLEVKCPNNSVPVYDVIVGCVACPVGTFYDPKPKTCIECPRGTYQPHVAKDVCFPCPNAQTTARSRAITKDECEDACAPGTWSSTGLPPCFDCDIGFYETSYGSISCTKCPGNRITIKEKSENISYCYDFDIVFPKDNGSPTVILDVSNVTLSIPYMISLHVKSEMSHGSILKLASTGNTVIEIGVSNTFIQGHTKQHSKELDLKKRWYHMLLKMDTNTSSLFVDGDECVSFSSININYVANITITLGGDGFAGVISQLNIKNGKGVSASITKKERCFNNNDARGPITWFDFAFSAMGQSYIDIPSRCDDNDACEENPCKHGNCTDNLNSYSCFCEKGFSGLNCEVNIDDCARNGCQNNATCQDGVHDYLCICPYGYTGELCEVAMVDGEWSKWDSWAECSVSCGNGTRQRRRSCSDPLPDNGGKYCEGVNIETETCHREICRECSELVPTNHSTLSCTNSSNMIICTQKCDDGYWFDQDERYDYRCGNETFYFWDFQTKDNPYARLPYCTEVIESPVINVEYSAFYNISICSSDIEELMLARINSVFSSLKCYEDGICNSEMLQLMNCEGKRKRRDLTFKNVGYSTTLSCNTTFFGTAECYTRLEKAVDEVNNLKNSNLFNIQHDVDTYSILINSSRSDAGLECPVGSVPVIAYCVPCSIGHFFANDECVSCPVGTYQHFTGQTFCYICQKGKTTEGKNSVSEYDCNIAVIETNEKPWYVIGVVSSIPVLVICVVVAIIYSRKQRKKIPDKKSSQRGIDKVGKAKLNITMLLEHKGGQVQMNKERYGERVNKTFVDDFQQETYN